MEQRYVLIIHYGGNLLSEMLRDSFETEEKALERAEHEAAQGRITDVYHIVGTNFIVNPRLRVRPAKIRVERY